MQTWIPSNRGGFKSFPCRPPSLQDHAVDADRLVRVLKAQLQTDDIHIDFNLLKRLPQQLRNSAFKVKCSLEEIDTIRDRTTYLELYVNQEFMSHFSAARFLPHTDLSRFPSVKTHRMS